MIKPIAAHARTPLAVALAALVSITSVHAQGEGPDQRDRPARAERPDLPPGGRREPRRNARPPLPERSPAELEQLIQTRLETIERERAELERLQDELESGTPPEDIQLVLVEMTRQRIVQVRDQLRNGPALEGERRPRAAGPARERPESPVDPDELIDTLHNRNPEMADRMRTFRRIAPDRFERFVGMHGPRIMNELGRRRLDAPPDRLPPDIQELARTAAGTGTDAQDALQQLRSHVAEEFDRRAEQADALINQLEDRLVDLQLEHEQRLAEREQIIETKADELIRRVVDSDAAGTQGDAPTPDEHRPRTPPGGR